MANVSNECSRSVARRRSGAWKIRLRTAVTGSAWPVGIWSSPSPETDWSSVDFPTRACPLTPTFTVSRASRASSTRSSRTASAAPSRASAKGSTSASRRSAGVVACARSASTAEASDAELFVDRAPALHLGGHLGQ